MIYSDHHASLLTTTSAKKHFEFLRDLRLVSVNLSDQVFVMILSSCSSLEKLCLMFCHSLVNAKNTAPHQKLKSFELYACQALETLVLLAPHLVSFKYYGYERTLCVKDAHQLASLSLGINIHTDPNESDMLPRGKTFIFSQFSSYLPKLESLAVAVHIFRDMSNFAHLPEFSSLKHLAVDVASSAWMQLGYQLVVSILGAAPSLELLEIYLQLPLDRSYLNEQNIQVPNLGSKPRHQSLKEVKVFGFRGDFSMMTFLDYLIKYTIHLQKLDVTARGAIRGFDKLMLQPFILWSEDDATYCKECVRQLRQALPENAQLLFHEE